MAIFVSTYHLIGNFGEETPFYQLKGYFIDFIGFFSEEASFHMVILGRGWWSLF